MPYSFCSLSLSCKFLSALYPSNKIPSAVFLFSYFRCPSAFSCMWSFQYLWEFCVITLRVKCDLNGIKWIKNTGRRNYLQMLNLNLSGFPFLFLSFSAFCDLYECNIKDFLNLRWFADFEQSSANITDHNNVALFWKFGHRIASFLLIALNLLKGRYSVKACFVSICDIFKPLCPLQPALDTVLPWMWRHGEDGQEACTLQKLPETSVRPVAQEQVGVCHIWSCCLDHPSL